MFFHPSLSGAPVVRVIMAHEPFTRAANQGGSTLRSRKYLLDLLMVSPTYVTGGDELLGLSLLVEDGEVTATEDKHDITLPSFLPVPEGTVVVYTDGGCYRVPTIVGTAPVVHAAIGVFWGNYDARNVSAACQLPPFSNQRAELEAIIVAPPTGEY
jgi:hypothetical protein